MLFLSVLFCHWILFLHSVCLLWNRFLLGLLEWRKLKNILIQWVFTSFQVASNPYHYDSHVELIKLLRESGDLDKVRQAREDMNKIFPLTQGFCITKNTRPGLHSISCTLMSVSVKKYPLAFCSNLSITSDKKCEQCCSLKWMSS